MHGYTLAGLDELTRAVLYLDRWYSASGADERYAAVWHAIAEELLTSAEPPHRQQLISAGVRASDQHVKTEMRHAGFDRAQNRTRIAGYERYWMATPSPSPESKVVERLAVHQVLPLLTARQYQALMALAVYEDYEAAARSIGSTYKTFTSLIKQGRRRVYAAWHQGETPPRRAWRVDRRAPMLAGFQGNGRRLTVSEVEALRERYTAGEKLRAVASDAGVPVSTLSALLRGTRKPAPDPDGAL